MEPSGREERPEKAVIHTRKGLTYSTKATNPSGLSEGRIKRLLDLESAPPGGYKK